jgi:PHD/YefM family antitoxin component YafN of YafNO toxin-antitoxin module
MSITTVSDHQFNRDISGVKEATQRGPVFIMGDGKLAYVLMTMEDYLRLSGNQMTLAQALAQVGAADSDYEPTRV